MQVTRELSAVIAMQKAAAQICEDWHQSANAQTAVAIRALDPAAFIIKTDSADVAKPLAESAVASHEHIVPKWAGQFDSFEQWVSHAQSRLTPSAICIDAKGRRCYIGKEFMRARDEDAFPVRFFWEFEVSASHECGSVLDERAAFERRWKHLDFAYRQARWSEKQYVNSHVQALWEGWQARAELGNTVEQEAIAKPDSVNFDKPIETAANPRGGVMRDLLDADGENRAVRTFLQLYAGCAPATTQQMRNHLTMSGFEHYWPDWTNKNEHLTKAGAQIWLRYLFSLERAV